MSIQDRSTFEKVLDEAFSSQTKDFFFPLRKRAWDSYSKIGIPHRKHEAFKYLTLQPLKEFSPLPGSEKVSNELINSYVLDECKRSYAIFVDGVFQKKLSNFEGLLEKDSKIFLSSIEEAAKSYHAFLQNRMVKEMSNEQDPFALLNLALKGSGLFIYVAPEVQEKKPLQIIHFVTSSCKSFPKIQGFIGHSSSFHFIEKIVPLGDQTFFYNPYWDISVDRFAKVKLHTYFQKGKGWNFSNYRVAQKANSSFESFCFSEGGKTYRTNYRVSLEEKEASCKLGGLSLLKETNQMHHYVRVNHQSPQTYSNQQFKAVVSDESLSSFEGKIYVAPKCPQVEAYQLSPNLLLSSKAKAYVKPNLEIFTDDVKASHGATVSMMREEDLFYLLTRGLSKKEAQKLLLKAFYCEILEEFHASSYFKNKIEKLMDSL